jgi:hypothetical protein
MSSRKPGYVIGVVLLAILLSAPQIVFCVRFGFEFAALFVHHVTSASRSSSKQSSAVGETFVDHVDDERLHTDEY